MKTVFQRYEYKYLLTTEQKQKLMALLAQHLVPDQYGVTTIRNLYFDTPDFRLIRRSIDKPSYKEKLRLRCYATAGPDTPVFVELKKKYRGVVYKRRLAIQEPVAMDWLCGNGKSPLPTQIAAEVDYFLDFYGALRPVVYLSYRREAFYGKDGGDLRITFDNQICARFQDLSLTKEPCGQDILPEDMVMMEIKCSGGIPLWFTSFLSQEKIYKTSFSKYGTVYRTMIYPNLIQEEMDYGNTIQRLV